MIEEAQQVFVDHAPTLAQLLADTDLAHWLQGAWQGAKLVDLPPTGQPEPIPWGGGICSRWRCLSCTLDRCRGRRNGWIMSIRHTEAEIAALRRCVVRGAPFGDTGSAQRIATSLGLEFTLRSPGRPRGSDQDTARPGVPTEPSLVDA